MPGQAKAIAEEVMPYEIVYRREVSKVAVSWRVFDGTLQRENHDQTREPECTFQQGSPGPHFI